MKKIFGEIKLSWLALVIFAVLCGVFTAAMAIIPGLHYTSFYAVTTTFEVWIFIGIFIIMNSRSCADSALKCFVFFLISQPLVYLIQVPFKDMGWGLFIYYKYWFIWTLLCLPMGYIGYLMKKDKWWGYIILSPMIGLTVCSLYYYFRLFVFSRPRYLLISMFCIAAMLIYPSAIFKSRKIRITGTLISAVLTAVTLTLCLTDPIVYSTEIMSNDEYGFDESYTACFTDGDFGDVEIQKMSDFCLLHADFKKAGTAVLIMESPDGEKREFTIRIENDRFEIIQQKLGE